MQANSPLAQMMMQMLAQPASQPQVSTMNSQGLYPPGHFYPDRMPPQPGEGLAELLRRRFMQPMPADPGVMLPRDQSPTFVVPSRGPERSA